MVDVYEWGIGKYGNLVAFFFGSIFGPISIQIEHLETVHQSTGSFRRRGCPILLLRNVLSLWQRLSTFIRVPLDSHAFICDARHHTSPCEERIVDGIELEISIIILE
jgi:hypothetical protein